MIDALLFALMASAPSAAGGSISEVELDGSLFIMELDARGQGDEARAKLKDVARTLTDLITTEIASSSDRKIISSNEVKELLDLETQRALNECDDQSCLADIAGALDAQFVIVGSVSQFGEVFILNLALTDKSGRFLKRESMQTEGDVSALFKAFRTALNPLLEVLDPNERPRMSTNEPQPRDEEATAPVLGLTLFGVGTGLAVLSGTLAAVMYYTTATPSLPLTTRQQTQPILWGTTVFAGLSVGVAGLGVSMVVAE